MTGRPLAALLSIALFVGCGDTYVTVEGQGGRSDGAGGTGGGGSGGGDTFVPVGLSISAPAIVQRAGGSLQLGVYAVDAAGVHYDIAREADYFSSDEAIATVDETGRIHFHAGGPYSITARWGGFEASMEGRASCSFPLASDGLGLGATMPQLTWNAKSATGEPFPLALHELGCMLEWAWVDTVAFVLFAGWSVPDTNYIQQLEQVASSLRQRGMQLVFVAIDTQEVGHPADTTFAFSHLKDITRQVPGIAVGDGEPSSNSRFFRDVMRHDQPDERYLRAFPTTFVVRTKDMKVIADGSHGGWSGRYHLPLEKIAQDPDADWSVPEPWMFE